MMLEKIKKSIREDAIELLESQGVSILYKYLKGIFEASEKTNVTNLNTYLARTGESNW